MSTVTYYDQKSVPLPYYQRMIVDLQQQVGAREVFTISYAGVQGRKGIDETNINLPTYQTGWTYGSGAGDPTFNAARPQWNSVVTTYPSGSAQYPFGSVNGAGDARIGQVVRS